MTTIYEEKRPCIGGSFNTYTIEETNEWNGEKLGAFADGPIATTLVCDHYEDENAESIKVGGVWYPKSKIRQVVWQTNVLGVRTLCKIVVQ